MREAPDADHVWHGIADEQVEKIFPRSLAWAWRVLGSGATYG